jgi:tetratricopeptide (TPR) repeat protein
MKKNALILILLFTALVSSAQQDLLQKAEKAYDEKKYGQAIEAYEKLVNEGYTSYELYYNLGNAYYRNQQLGRAIYNYELARKLEPNDEDVRLNLAIAAGKTIDKIDSKENFFVSAVKSNVLLSLSTRTWAWITIFCVALTCVLFFLYLVSGNLNVKRFSFLGAGLGFLGFFVTYFLGYSAAQAKYENKFAIVLSREAKVMNEPTRTASGKFGLHEGTKVNVVNRNGDWLLIRLDNGNEGWLKMSDVGII